MAAPLLPSLPPAHFVQRRRHFDLWLVASDSHPDEPHRVVAHRDGPIHCPCPLHTLGGKRCRHIQAVEAAMKETGTCPEPDPKAQSTEPRSARRSRHMRLDRTLTSTHTTSAVQNTPTGREALPQECTSGSPMLTASASASAVATDSTSSSITATATGTTPMLPISKSSAGDAMPSSTTVSGWNGPALLVGSPYLSNPLSLPAVATAHSPARRLDVTEQAATSRQFNPTDHLTNLEPDSRKPARLYLECRWRLVWLRQDHPDAIVTTEILEHNAAEKWAIIKATVTIPGAGSATGMALQAPTSIAKDYIANGETSALGRALAALGYGTQHATELDQGEQVVDSPVERKPTAANLSGKPDKPEQDNPLTAARRRLAAAAGKVEWTPEHITNEMTRRTKAPRPQWTAADYNALAMDLEAVASGDADLNYDSDGRPVFVRGPVEAPAV